MIKNLLAYADMLKNAQKDGIISEDEERLLESISGNYGVYQKSLKDAVKDGIIGDEEEAELRKLRKRIYEEALKTALADGVITDEEKAILNILKDSIELDDYTLEIIESKAQSSSL